MDKEWKTNSNQIVIIGGGIAGLTAALKCSEHSTVTVLYKTTRTSSASAWAQGGIAAVQTHEDSFASHIQDTLDAGYGLCHPERVKQCIEEAPARLQELKNWGVHFNDDLHREGGHHFNRIAHIADHTGRSIMEKLIERAAANPRIQLVENHLAIDVLEQRDGGVCGLYILNRQTGAVSTLPAKAVVIATGGAGKAYLYSSNPPEASGDGIAIGLRAGCQVGNMEFFQFHPTLLYHPVTTNFLVTEALRGAGAQLLSINHNRFTDEMSPRDQVARAIDQEMKRSGSNHVWLDCRKIDHLEQRFPLIVQRCRSAGVDPVTMPIPVVPGAHYCCGGIVSDASGRTNRRGLYVIGEAALTGLHGANRLASNSLLEALVFAHEVSRAIATDKLEVPPPILPEWDFGASQPLKEEVLISHLWSEVRRCMWDFVGIVRSDLRLQKALNRLRLIDNEVNELYWSVRPTATLLELRNLCLVAQAIAHGALLRKESRGLHYMLDYPETKPEYTCEFHGRLDAFGRLQWNAFALPLST